MRDAIFAYGTLANATISLATKNTDYYAGGALGTAYIDLGTISSTSRFTRHTLDKDLYAVWRALSAFNAADQITPFVYEDTVAAFNVNNQKAVIYPSTIAGVVWPIGQEWRFRMVETVFEFIVQGATALSSGTYTATTVEAFFEHGARAGYARTLGGNNL